MKSFTAVVLLATLLLATACDDGEEPTATPAPTATTTAATPTPTASGPSVQIIVEGDLSGLPPGTDLDGVWEDVRDVLQRRIDALGVSGDISRDGVNRWEVEVTGIDPGEARDLIGKTAQLEFHRPVLDESEEIVCETAQAGTYAIPYQPGRFVLDRENNGMRCPPEEEGGADGFVKWEPATALDGQGVQRALNGAYLRPNSRVGADPSECGNMTPCVLLQFTGEGSVLFEQITEELIGLPLSIFLDEEIIGAPTVTEPISGGATVITGFDLEEARTLAIQLNAGVLPAPLRIVSVDEKP
ncbi:MAG: hypothetical protein GTN75_01580 [Gemmatimonadetes bacterium]|nr:hypothetical protein [Gemmatimonadota bacterium]